MDEAGAVRWRGGNRNPAGLRYGRFRRGADARTARAGSAPARARWKKIVGRHSGTRVFAWTRNLEIPGSRFARPGMTRTKNKDPTMRFMMLMIPLGYETAPPDVELDPERVSAMMKYNQALKDAGVLIALDGLHPPSTGARVSFASGKPVVTDGPFTEAKEVLGGYWMIDVKSREEAIAWATKCPASSNEIIEIRQVQEMSDFSPEVQQAAAGFAELQAGSRR